MNVEHRRRLLLLVVLVTAGGGSLAFLALGGIGDSLVYYFSPAELLAEGRRAPGAAVRLGGLVEPGSIEHGDGLELRFRVTDGRRSVPVFARTVPPAMFRESIGVVLEGKLDDRGVFVTHRLMVKHDNEYQPPDEHDERSFEQLLISLQIGGGEG